MLALKKQTLVLAFAATALLGACHAGDKGHTIAADSVKTFGPYSKDTTASAGDAAAPALMADTGATKNADKTANTTDTVKKDPVTKKPDTTKK